MVDTTFDKSYIATDAIFESMIGNDPRAAAVALKAAAVTAQAWYCQEASRHIDALPLRGVRYEEAYIENGVQKDIDGDGLTQVLEFPRVIEGFVQDWDHGTDEPIVPELVKRACLEEAIAIYKLTDTPDLDFQQIGIQQIQVGVGSGFQATYKPGFGIDALLSVQAKKLMRRYIGVAFG
jgi:hypothetical protein